jgi:biotin carboxyl carrier protein
VLEAMKMNNQIRAPQDGVIAEIQAAVGTQVNYGDPLMRFE